MRYYILYFFAVIIFTSCNNNIKNTSDLSEGELEYKIIYPSQLENKGSTVLLPHEMITFFKNDKISLNIKGGFGLYNLSYISRSLGDTCYTLFKLFDKKLYYPMVKDQTLFVFRELGKPKIKLFKDSIKTIAGFTCKKAVISFPGKGIKPINAYYSEELCNAKPNINTPFEKIPGILMEFNFFYKNLSFKVTAEKFTPVSIPDSEFGIPKGYEKTTEEEIEGFIATLLQ